MRATTKAFLILAIGVSLAGCLQTAREDIAAAANDDDVFCQRNAGPPGSNPYAACLKDRDVARSNRQARMDRTHRRVSEDMLHAR